MSQTTELDPDRIESEVDQFIADHIEALRASNDGAILGEVPGTGAILKLTQEGEVTLTVGAGDEVFLGRVNSSDEVEVYIDNVNSDVLADLNAFEVVRTASADQKKLAADVQRFVTWPHAGTVAGSNPPRPIDEEAWWNAEIGSDTDTSMSTPTDEQLRALGWNEKRKPTYRELHALLYEILAETARPPYEEGKE